MSAAPLGLDDPLEEEEDGTDEALAEEDAGEYLPEEPAADPEAAQEALEVPDAKSDLKHEKRQYLGQQSLTKPGLSTTTVTPDPAMTLASSCANPCPFGQSLSW